MFSHLCQLVVTFCVLIQQSKVACFSAVDFTSEHMELKRRPRRLSGYVIPLVCCGSLFECFCTWLGLIYQSVVSLEKY